jgi:hypothetical protein
VAVQAQVVPHQTTDGRAIAEVRWLLPGEVTVFELDEGFLFGDRSVRQEGSHFRLVAHRPVSAYLFSPFVGRTANEASLLLPDDMLGTLYVVASYPAFLDPGHPQGGGDPSYFTVVALTEDTRLEWIPTVDTAAGPDSAAAIPGVAARARGITTIRGREIVRIGNAEAGNDLSGTVVRSDHPVWAASGVACAYVPEGSGLCDHLHEVLIPVERWGMRYLALPSPARGAENHIWRIYAGAPQVLVSSSPPVTQSPAYLANIGDFLEMEVAHGTATLLEASGPIMPVQYLVGRDAGAGTGDPSMTQTIPVDQWRSAYAFHTGEGYDSYIAQVARSAGSADIIINGTTVSTYTALGDYEYADWPLTEGGAFAHSETNFSLTLFAYLGQGGKWASVASPGGLADHGE